jgi:hypothetical protein
LVRPSPLPPASATGQAQLVSFAEPNVVIVVLDDELGVSGEACVPAGIRLEIIAVGSTVAIGWMEISMLLPLPVALEMHTPAKPTMA